MSYCRWSTNDFQCDVYVYEHVDGFWQIHVASNRRTPDEPFPETIAPETDQDWKKYWEREEIVRKMLDNAERKPIGLKYDSESFECDSPGECADTLKILRDEGYNVPEGVIESLLEEQKEYDA